MRIGINGSSLMVDPNIDAVIDDIIAADAEGFATYSLLQSNLADSLMIFGAVGSRTSNIEMSTAVVPTWVQHPARLAGSALTAQALTGGRITLGIGLAHEPAVTERYRMEWKKPIRHMLDFLEILNGLMTDGKVSHDGEIWGFEGDMAGPKVAPPTVMLAALGDQMLKIAGERTDGTILWCVGPKTIGTHIAPKINEAAANAGRPAPSIVCSIPVWVTDNPKPAREFLAAVLAGYSELPSYRAMLNREGLHGLGELSFVGSADQVQERMAEVEAAGATDFTGVIMGGNPDELAATREVLKRS